MPVAQHGNGFGIGFRQGQDLMLRQFFADLFVVLDDPVVNNCHAPDSVRVGVVGCRSPMRGPARMTYTSQTGQRVGRQQIIQIDQLAHRPTTIQFSVANGRNTSAVIAPIL